LRVEIRHQFSGGKKKRKLRGTIGEQEKVNLDQENAERVVLVAARRSRLLKEKVGGTKTVTLPPGFVSSTLRGPKKVVIR